MPLNLTPKRNSFPDQSAKSNAIMKAVNIVGNIAKKLAKCEIHKVKKEAEKKAEI